MKVENETELTGDDAAKMQRSPDAPEGLGRVQEVYKRRSTSKKRPHLVARRNGASAVFLRAELIGVLSPHIDNGGSRHVASLGDRVSCVGCWRWRLWGTTLSPLVRAGALAAEAAPHGDPHRHREWPPYTLKTSTATASPR